MTSWWDDEQLLQFHVGGIGQVSGYKGFRIGAESLSNKSDSDETACAAFGTREAQASRIGRVP